MFYNLDLGEDHMSEFTLLKKKKSFSSTLRICRFFCIYDILQIKSLPKKILCLIGAKFFLGTSDF